MSTEEKRGVDSMLLRRKKSKLNKDRLLLVAIMFICAGLVLAVAVYIFQLNSRAIRADLYLYDTGYRFDYPGPSQIHKTEKGMVLESNGGEILLEMGPLYYKDQERMLLPMVMVACLPSDNRFGKLDYFTEVYQDNNGIFAKRGYHHIPLGKGFLHNGKDLYVFLENTTVNWQEKSVSLEPFSYAIVIYNQRLEIYSAKGGECVLEDTGVCKVIAVAESGYKIDLGTDIMYRPDGHEQMLFAQPSTLKELK
jgi:hypothetical protein